MNSQEFANLYTHQNSDEAITPFQNEVGFSLIRSYPTNTPYYKDGKRMFIKIGALNRGFFYGVDMTNPQKRNDVIDYVLTDGEEYKKKVTNFISEGEEFSFDNKANKVVHNPTNKSFTINEFVEILVSNHLSDRLFWKRKINGIANLVLKFIFWLSDKHYDRVKTAIDKFHFNQKQTYSEEKINNVDPFFKYFLISRNTLFIGLVTALLMAVLVNKYNILEEFTISNPLIVLAFFLFLSICEKISILLNTKIKEFFTQRQFYNEKPNFIERVHDYQYRNKFRLKLNKQKGYNKTGFISPQIVQ